MTNGVIVYFFSFLGLMFFGSATPAMPTTPAVVPAAATPEQSVSVATPPSGPADTQALSKCLANRGAKLYGAYWCPHCADQKEEFGDALQFVNYVECDAGGPNGNPEACIDAKIEGYPTWQMPDKADLVGAQSFEALANWSGCPYSS